MKKLWLILFPALCLGALLILWIGSYSPGSGSSPTPVGPEPVSDGIASTTTSFLILRICLALGLVVALIVGAVHALRALGWNRSAAQLGRVRVLDRCFLGPRKALYTVRIGERHVVVGVTEASIQPVLELSAEEGGALYPDADNNDEVPRFADILRNAARKVGRR